MMSSLFLALLVAYSPPAMPAPQPGDDTTVEVTVGEMRQALWYKAQYEVLLSYARDLEKQADSVMDEYKKAYDRVVVLERKVQSQSTWITVLGGAAVVGVGLSIIFILVR